MTPRVSREGGVVVPRAHGSDSTNSGPKPSPLCDRGEGGGSRERSWHKETLESPRASRCRIYGASLDGSCHRCRLHGLVVLTLAGSRGQPGAVEEGLLGGLHVLGLAGPGFLRCSLEAAAVGEADLPGAAAHLR